MHIYGAIFFKACIAVRFFKVLLPVIKKMKSFFIAKIQNSKGFPKTFVSKIANASVAHDIPVRNERLKNFLLVVFFAGVNSYGSELLVIQ